MKMDKDSKLLVEAYKKIDENKSPFADKIPEALMEVVSEMADKTANRIKGLVNDQAENLSSVDTTLKNAAEVFIAKIRNQLLANVTTWGSNVNRENFTEDYISMYNINETPGELADSIEANAQRLAGIIDRSSESNKNLGLKRTLVSILAPLSKLVERIG